MTSGSDHIQPRDLSLANAREPNVDVRGAPSPDWDPFVGRSPTASFCHLAGWSQVFGDLMGHDCHFLEARTKDGDLEGVLPLVRVRSRLFGDYLISVPFLNYGGPIGTEVACRALARTALRLAEEIGSDLLELRTRHELALPLALNPRKVLVLLPLPEEPETLWNEGFKSKFRTKLRRAEKEGIEVRFGTHLVRDFYEVFSRNMRDLGTPVLPEAFFHKLPEVFGDRVLFSCAYLEDRPIAAGCGFVHHDEFEITWSSSLREHNRLNPNMLMYWRIMERVIGIGVRTFNFGRSTPGAGTHEFKLSWGGESHPLPWMVHSPGDVAKPPSPQDRGFSLATKVWQRLPVSLTRVIGPRISPYIP